MRSRTLEAFVMALVMFAPASAYAGWQDQASSFDQGRLARLDEARSRGMSEAGGNPELHAMLDAPSMSGGSLSGMWRCRTIKLGGMTPSVVYSWFRCRISNSGEGLFFEKLSGSQRMAGALYPQAGGYVYLGASWVKGEIPHRYSGGGASVGAAATPDDQIGMLTATGGASARLELPYPVQESDFDVIELRR